MAVKWTRETRSKNIIQEKIRKKISDKVHPQHSVGKIDMNKIIIAKTRRFRRFK